MSFCNPQRTGVTGQAQGRAICRLLVQVIQHVRELRLLKPAAVIGTGCYAAFPACLAAAICGTPLFLIEPNSIPGLLRRSHAIHAVHCNQSDNDS